MIPRILEPEAMDTAEEAASYDAMGHQAVNTAFVVDFLRSHGPCRGGEILDIGTGTARIPIILCEQDADARVLAIDLAEHMLDLARRNVEGAQLGGRIALEKVDGKGLPYPDGRFEAVISNTILHHVPEPSAVMAEMARLVAPGGTLFCRDLVRPDSSEELDRLVRLHAAGEPEDSRKLFADSLNASLTLDEVREAESPRWGSLPGASK